MAFEDIKAEIDILLQEMINQPENVHELEFMIREQINNLKAQGLPLPADLQALDKKLNKSLDK